MSRLFEALSALQAERRSMEAMIPMAVPAPPVTISEPPKPKSKSSRPRNVVLPALGSLAEVVAGERSPSDAEVAGMRGLVIHAAPESYLVAFTDPASLGAEKFRALVARFDHLRDQRQLRSLQVTSSVINEGKTLVSGNLAVTLAQYSGAKTLLMEGDLHRPTLADFLGLDHTAGLGDWWAGPDQELLPLARRVHGMPLWFLSAGKPCDQPSDILRSERFQKAFAHVASQFEWVIVDSTPMLPIVDVNLWSRLLDGTLLVVREGVAPLKVLKRGLQALDNPKWIGVVVNDATEFEPENYAGEYYGGSPGRNRSARNS